jgi:hypothetical protein
VSDNQTLSLEMSMRQSDFRETIAECIFWYWCDKDIRIFKVGLKMKPIAYLIN